MKELWPGGLRYEGDSIGIDSMALAAFVPPVSGHGIDLGCGSGILSLLLLRENPTLTMTGIELRRGAAEQFRKNLAENGLSDRGDVITADLRTIAPSSGSADLVITNPPYFPAGSGIVSPDPDRAFMRHESLPFSELCKLACRLLRANGVFCFVHVTRRLPELLTSLSGAGLAAKRIRMIAADPSAAPSLFLCEAIKHSSADFRLEPVLFQRLGDGPECDEYRKITHWEI